MKKNDDEAEVEKAQRYITVNHDTQRVTIVTWNPVTPIFFSLMSDPDNFGEFIEVNGD